MFWSLTQQRSGDFSSRMSAIFCSLVGRSSLLSQWARLVWVQHQSRSWTWFCQVLHPCKRMISRKTFCWLDLMSLCPNFSASEESVRQDLRESFQQEIRK
ncbi:unnamed protein product [Symbiodinium natans]|uniref:Uncharacterized protein n=1 Tax=Symbiodinium natans TaxID=878477 RepID=A0A812H8K1_9DINO|nr:unnamed protein product [Symbiodinium natans]